MANLTIIKRAKEDSFLYDVVAPAGLVNGNVVALGTRQTNGTFTVAAPVAISSLGVVIVASVQTTYGVEEVENDYVIATGDVVRAYVPEIGQQMSFPVANFETSITPVQGKFVIMQAGDDELIVANALGGTESVAWIVDEVFTKNGVSMMTIRCIKA